MSHRLVSSGLRHVDSACCRTFPAYCDCCSSHQRQKRSEHNFLFIFQYNAFRRSEFKLLLIYLFSREQNTGWWKKCELKSQKIQYFVPLKQYFRISNAVLSSQVENNGDEVNYENVEAPAAVTSLHWSTTFISTTTQKKSHVVFRSDQSFDIKLGFWIYFIFTIYI